MTTTARRERERQETRTMILDAARELFVREGYEAVTMRAIADRIEYTPTAIYHHFENKQALVTELAHQALAALAQHFQRLATVADPVERLTRTGEAYVEFAEQYPNHYRFLFMTVLPKLEHPEGYLATRHRNPEHDAYEFLKRACAEAIAQGRLRPELTDADQVAQMIWASLHGLVSLRIVKGHQDWIDFKDLRETARRSREAMLRGIQR